MRSFAVVMLALAVVSGNAVSGQAPDRPVIPSTRLQLKATMDPASAKLGTAITVNLVLKNISSKIVRVPDTSPEYDYELILADSKGNKLTLTDFGDGLYQGKYVLLRSSAIDMEPGQEVQSQIEVTKIYQVTQPGVYYLRASHRNIVPDPADQAKSTVERTFSSPVQFTVVP
jgi:hypothetical protein